ncbi:polysaccharide biosynthesis/export family protein [Tsuneonella suprasediminis]|nr:polysaccharide biosynthesis/export family protein [Tsuneonella suprasediminis]
MSKLRIIMKFKRLFASGLALLLTSACASTQPYGQSPGVEVTDLTSLPAPHDAFKIRVMPGEKLTVNVLNSEPLSGEFMVDEEGNLLLPLAGSVHAAGETTTTVSAKIRDALAGRYVRDPQVTVLTSEENIPVYSIGGQVVKPGTYPANIPLTLSKAINQAGGLDKYAKKNEVLVIRNVDDKRYIGVFNIAAIQRGNYVDPIIYPNDIITVGDSAASRRLDKILQFIPLLSYSVILLDRVTN